jgi:hypothetical protein
MNNHSLLIGVFNENEEESFFADLDSYTDVMSDFEDK